MATILLAEAQKLGLNDLSAGVATEVATANDLGLILPFNTTFGNAYAYNREGTPGNVFSAAIGASTSSVKTQVTFSQQVMALTSILGDAEVNDLIVAQGVGANAGNDPVSAAIASKAKQVGREFFRQCAVGNLTTPGTSVSGVTNTQEFDGLETLLTSTAFASQYVDEANAALTLDMLDALLHKVLVGQVQFIMAPSAAIRKIRALMRGLGGVTRTEVSGVQIDAYDGIPLIRNDYMTADTATGTSGVQQRIIAGCFDDGTRTKGVSGVVPTSTPAWSVTPVGPAEAGDYNIYRVKMYGAMAVHSTLSVAMLDNVTVA